MCQNCKCKEKLSKNSDIYDFTKNIKQILNENQIQPSTELLILFANAVFEEDQDIINEYKINMLRELVNLIKQNFNYEDAKA